MKKIIIHWLVSALAIIIAAYLLPGAFVTLQGSLLLALVLGLINVFIRPIISLMALPITIVTLGLFSLVINALLIMLAVYIVPGAEISGFFTACLFAIILSIINIFFHRLTRLP